MKARLPTVNSLAVLLTIPNGSRRPYTSNNCNLWEYPAQDTLTLEEWRSSLDSFAKVDGIVFREPLIEEGLGPFPLRETHLYLPRGLLLNPWA
jgi:hypothetical protein